MSKNSNNPYSGEQAGKSSDNAKRAGIAAAAAGAGVAGAAGAAAYRNHLVKDREPEMAREAEELQNVAEPVVPPATPHSNPVPPHTPETPEVEEIKSDPAPHDENPDQPSANGAQQPSADELARYDENNLDPDTEVDRVLAEEKIDHDGDEDAAGDMIIHDYEEVGMIYGDDGEAQTAAIAYDPTGQPILLVDVDGDNMFDQARTSEGDFVDVSELAINVGDAELEAAPDDQYLANNGENMDNFEGEDFSVDIIS